MERNGVQDEISFGEGVGFTGRRCLKFLKKDEIIRNTVSIAPIIGRSYVGNKTYTPGFEKRAAINNIFLS